jgi:hypothetical protein
VNCTRAKDYHSTWLENQRIAVFDEADLPLETKEEHVAVQIATLVLPRGSDNGAPALLDIDGGSRINAVKGISIGRVRGRKRTDPSGRYHM